MASRDTKGLPLKEDGTKKGLFFVDAWDEQYDFFEQLELFEPGFRRSEKQKRLPLERSPKED